MNVLLQNAKLVDSASPLNGKTVNIHIVDGVIKGISEKNIDAQDANVYKADDLHVSAGWFDFTCHYKDPGHEWMENLESLQLAAAYGGFTEIAGFPNTQPVVQTKESIAYFRNFSKYKPVYFHNYAAITKNCEGVDFTDLMDLHYNGAIGFTDGVFPLQNADIFLKTLQYLFSLNTFLINRPEDKYLSMFGQMHEGLNSTMLGLKGIPSASEELMIIRDLKLLEYASLKSELPILHFSAISTKESVELIRKAKAKGLPVSCDVAAHQLSFTDNNLSEFDTNLKVNPPFRSEKDKAALIEGLKDGTIDIVTSDHNPLDSEHKNLEFDLADFGIIGLQTAFASLNTTSRLHIAEIIEKLTIQPRRILRKQPVTIKEGELANLTLFNPNSESIFELDQIVSLSKNSPFIGKTMKGKVYGIYNNKSLILNEKNNI